MNGGREIARHKRIWYPQATYHLMERGIRRQSIFEDKTDYQVFLELLKITQEKYNCFIHAYCLLIHLSIK